jgi:hypothetical protein
MAGIISDEYVKRTAQLARKVADVILDTDDGDPVPHLDDPCFDVGWEAAGSTRRALRDRMRGLLGAYERKVAYAKEEAIAIVSHAVEAGRPTLQDACKLVDDYIACGNISVDEVKRAWASARRTMNSGPKRFQRHDWVAVSDFYEAALAKDPTLGGVTQVTELVRLLSESFQITRNAFYPWLKNPSYKTPPKLREVLQKNRAAKARSSRPAKGRASSPRKR